MRRLVSIVNIVLLLLLPFSGQTAEFIVESPQEIEQAAEHACCDTEPADVGVSEHDCIDCPADCGHCVQSSGGVALLNTFFVASSQASMRAGTLPLARYSDPLFELSPPPLIPV